MARTKSKKNSVRLSVTLDENDYAELTRIGDELDLSAAWMIRRAVSEFVARHRTDVTPDLPLQPAGGKARGKKTAGGTNGN